MPKTTPCTLCSSPAPIFTTIKGKCYFACTQCQAVFLDPLDPLRADQEKQRYLEHNNDVEDLGYQKFARPIIDAVKMNFKSSHAGLDFGAGPGPVTSKLLHDDGYTIDLYDPFFWNDPTRLQTTYDYIICCEVMEHFKDPKKEFSLLRSLLKENGKLFCMTSLYDTSIDFKNWYYKNDRTHRFFYHKDSLEYIKANMGFSSLTISGSMIQLDA